MSPQPFSSLAGWDWWNKRMGWNRWQTHTGVLLSSMSFSSVYNPALFIPSRATQPLIFHSRRPYCPKCESLVGWFFFFLKQKSSEILLSLCRGKKSTPHPQKASLDSSAVFCFITLLLLILRQITCNSHKKKKKKLFQIHNLYCRAPE